MTLQLPQRSSRRTSVLLIAVNYNSAEATSVLLQDALRQTNQHCSLTIVVADNSPSLSDLDALREKYRECPAVRFETMSGNLGYFGAAHQVVQSLPEGRVPDWIIVSNTDIRLPHSDFFDRLAQFPAGPAVIAPRIISGRNGLDQNPFHRTRPSSFRMYLNRIIPRVPILFWMLQAQCEARKRLRKLTGNGNPPPALISGNIYAPHGAFIIFSKQYFQRGGTLNVGAFLFAEEKFVAETCIRQRLEVKYLPDLEVIHEEHVSTEHNPAIAGFQAAAADYLYREFFRGTHVQRSAPFQETGT